MKKVSILIPAYNVEKFIVKCLDSIVNQCYQHLQVVIVDDGSKDNTLSICNEYAARYSYIEVHSQINAGVAAARNALLSYAKGDYVLFVDADDWIEPDMVSFLLELTEKYAAEMVVCGMVVNDAPVNDEYRLHEFNQEEIMKKFLFHNELNGSLWNKLVSKSLLHNITFDNRISYGEDALFVWHVLQRVKKVVMTDKQLYHYRMNENSISHQTWSPNKKGTGHLVWEQLVEDTRRMWPQYKKIAEVNYAISDMWQLYYAAKSNYPKDIHIEVFQKNIRSHIFMIYTSGLINIRKMFFATVAAFSYKACKLILQ